MVLPEDVTVKEENDNFESDAFEESSCEVEVKIEHVDSPEIDWCVENNQVFFESQEYSNEQYFDVFSYKELIEYSPQNCNICSQIFPDSFSLICHNTRHLELKLVPITIRYQCDECLLYFDLESELHKHLERKCQHSSTNDKLLVPRNIKTKETKSVITNNKPLILKNVDTKKTKSVLHCHICNKLLSYKIWHDHIKEVHSSKSFQCALCSMRFKAKRYLRTHMKFVHQNSTKIDPKMIPDNLKCKLCPAMFNHKYNLHLHMKNCHCEKVQCEICLSEMKKSNLPSHMRRVHYSDGKEHKCDCGKSFRSPRYLKIHIKNTHNNKKK
ncbi:unnamed protein product [Diatraea saccharalis]|uniref:C2H2-type domain-containing protein n=1 Tax=Diatraea saccharalis TaxID=40085 RepID=A0A9N9R5A8_9NEOP|nr:unnamed protein product [Diatraea saccharalis]